jgi:hypothetical protein
MIQTIEVRAVELVRRIRDDQAAQLAGKSPVEVMEFFNQAAQRASKRGRKQRAAAKSGKASNKALLSTVRKTLRG